MSARDSRCKAMADLLIRYERLWSLRLDKYSRISPTPYERELLKLARFIKADVMALLDARPRTALVDNSLATMKEQSLSVRKEELVSRLVWQMTDADRDGWYSVFVTLTVSPENYYAVFAAGSGHWRNYVRAVSRAVGARLGMSKRVADVSHIHDYLAVVERGGRTGRLHIHVVHLCKVLPVANADPNAGRTVPDLRELSSWRAFWSFGFVTAVPVRLGPMDVYARDGWYPVFVTLTVSPENYDAVFAAGSGHWRNYVRAVSRAVGARLGMSKRVADVSHIHDYLAVVERGGRTGRLHIHVVHLCKVLPVANADPNAGRTVPDLRELSSWRAFWSFGFVTAVPVRLGPMDRDWET